MSAEATAYVWKHSPYRGSERVVHLAIADVVNDLNDYKLWMSTKTLAKKANMSRATVCAALTKMVSMGYLEVVEANKHAGKPSVYRFLTPGADQFLDRGAQNDVGGVPNPRARTKKNSNEHERPGVSNAWAPSEDLSSEAVPPPSREERNEGEGYLEYVRRINAEKTA